MDLADGVLVLLATVLQTPQTVFVVDSDGEPGEKRPGESVDSTVQNCGKTCDNIVTTVPLLLTGQTNIPTS